MISQRMVLVLCLAAGVLCITGTVVRSLFSAAISKQRARISHGSQVVPSPFGQIEYALAGQGATVLVVHGAGGGFDQAIAIAGKLIEGGHQIIAPSRFDYLRSASPNDPSPENQAEAFTFLLDNLQIEKAAIVGISAGVLSSLQFASHDASPVSQNHLNLVSVQPAAAHTDEPSLAICCNFNATSTT